MLYKCLSMKDKILVGNVQFWVDQDILHCKFYNENDDFEFVKENIDTYLRVISFLSDGIYLPICFDLREVNGLFSFQVFKLLGTHPKIKDVFQYKAFLISPYTTKFLFSAYNFFIGPIFPNKTFTNSNKAINYCNTKLSA